MESHPDETTRPDISVTDGLSAEQVTRARAFVEAASTADGVRPLSEQSELAIEAGPGAARHLISSAGYANVIVSRPGEPAMIEAVVNPDDRRAGHGRALLEQAFAEASAMSEASPRVWAHGDLPGAVALAASMGLSRTRELLQLRREMNGTEGLDAIAADPSILLRTYAGPEDEAEILRVNNAAFDWHPEQGGWSIEQITERVRSDWFDPKGLFLAFDAPGEGTAGRALLGFHWTKMQTPTLGEVYIVGVDPSAQGRGLGRLLTLAGLHYFAARGVDAVMLYVEGDNTAALNTYGRLGFTRSAIDVAYGRV